ncbi:MAG: AAA family ATPase [Pirellulaceae bacterium]
MKIKDVQIDGFGVWSGLTVHSMPDTMTVFYGPNEAGKTTLMHFLRTMFYGFTPDRRTRYLPAVYGGKPGGAIRVTGPGGGYEICRRAQLDQIGSTGNLTVTGNDGLAQGQHRLAMLLGQVDESIFTNVFAIGLRELQELSTLDDTAAADELYKLSSGLDRVSLVDVTRQLKSARQQIVGTTPDNGQMQRLMLSREKLKDEIEGLIGNGRRWGELAALRSTQNAELEELRQRIAQWEVEARSFEVALQVRPNWTKRADLNNAMTALNARTELPESAAEKLAEISEQIAERQKKLAEVKEQRRLLRESARKLPLRSGILELAAKIEAAAEQAPWVSSIQKTIGRLESQIDSTKQQLSEDAARLGMSDEDQQALLDDRRMTRMPDLSRQAINALAEPASEVRMWSTRLKQAKQQSDVDKKEAERLKAELTQAMAQRGSTDIHAAMQSSGDTISLLRKRVNVQEVLDKQVARREQLEEEAVDLAVDEALPVERSFLMGILFVGGAFLTIWGLGKILPFLNTDTVVDNSQNGMLYVLFGLGMLFFGFMWSTTLDRNTVTDLEDVEDQIDAIRKEIRKTEAERDELERRLPAYNGPIESRLREAEAEIHSLEELLPIQHNLAAANERYQAARKRAAQAADSLRSAKSHWQRTLTQLGLAETLSPKSIRIMADGYESLLQTRRRLQSLEEELETRQFELGAITQRIDSLSRQAFAAKAASDAIAGDDGHDDFDEPRRPHIPEAKVEREPLRADVKMAAQALEQLSKLTSLVSSQEQYIHQKRGMREQDQQIAKQLSGIQKTIDKLERTHSAVLAEYGCESEEQLHEQLEIKHEHEKLTKQVAEIADRIQAIIGGSVPYESVTRLLDSQGAHDLEKRWEAIGQRTQQAEQRVAQLLQRQGELAQEMKSLAASSRLSEAKLELACVENQLKACSAHWQTLAVTTSLLDKVCEVYETERQPETLREASAFLSQLTEGKYVRIWTPLGKNQLRIDNARGQALPLEVLSRGTRETVFIALRLSLAAAYARRGVTLPLVMDDVLVNFDAGRAEAAAKVLRDFASLGHQVIMFTCHEHIMRTFYDIDVQVRVLPQQGQPGEAEVFHPVPIEEQQTVYEPEPIHQEIVDEPHYVAPEQEEIEEPEIKAPVSVAKRAEPPKKPIQVRLPRQRPQVQRIVVVEQPAEPDIDWLWYERNGDRFESEAQDVVASTEPVYTIHSEWVEPNDSIEPEPPEDLWWSRVGSRVSNAG